MKLGAESAGVDPVRWRTLWLIWGAHGFVLTLVLLYLWEVIPILERMYADFGTAFPARILWQFKLSTAVRDHPAITLAGATGVFALDALAHVRFRRNGRRDAARFWAVAPVVVIVLALVVSVLLMYDPITPLPTAG